MNAWIALSGLLEDEPTTVPILMSDFRSWLETAFQRLEVQCEECGDTCVWTCKMCCGTGVGVDGCPTCAICDSEPVQVCLCDDEPRRIQIANVIGLRFDRATLLRHVQKVEDKIVSACFSNGTLYLGRLAICPYATATKDVVVEERSYAHEQLSFVGVA